MAKKSKSTAVAARKSTAVVSAADAENWERALAVHAEEDAERLGSGEGGALSIRNSRFKYMGEDLGGDSINVIVLDFVHAKRYYGDAEFDEDDVQPPLCAAVSLDGKDMKPFDNAPEVQADACAGCWANQFGSSSKRAKAKACKAGRRLIVIAAGEEYYLDEDPDLVRLRLPVMSVKPWDSYIAKLKATTGKPCFGVITELSFDRSVDYPKLNFKAVGEVEPAYGRIILPARERARQQLLAVPDFTSSVEEDAAPPKKNGKGKDTPVGRAKEKMRGKPPRQAAPPEKTARRSKFS